MATKRVLALSTPSAPPPGTAIVTDALEIRRLLIRAASGRTAATLKLRKSEEMLQGSLLDVDPAREGVQFRISSSSSRPRLEKRECMLLIYMKGRSILGMNGLPSEAGGGIVCFAPPARLFKIQRRKDIRFEIPKAYEYVVEIDSIEQKGLRIRKRIVDLSESGLSFFVLSPREAALFRRGMLLHGCTLRLQNREIPVSLKIRSSGNKVGTEFEDLQPEDREFIAQFVYSHAAHLFY